MEDNEVNQDVQTDDIPVVEESAPSAEASGTEENGETQVSPQVKKQEEEQIPFHEHPRFRELIEQNRSMREQESLRGQVLDNLQRELAILREQAKPKVEQPKDPFLAALESVDPKYAQSLQGIYGKAAKVEQLEQRLAQYEQQQYAKEAQGHFNKLLDTNKVTDPFDRKVYERAVRAEVYERESQGQKLSLKDLDKIVNDFHTDYSKTMEERSRKVTASYVQAKTGDRTPKATTGGAAITPAAKKIASGDISSQAKWLANEIRNMKKTI